MDKKLINRRISRLFNEKTFDNLNLCIEKFIYPNKYSDYNPYLAYKYYICHLCLNIKKNYIYNTKYNIKINKNIIIDYIFNHKNEFGNEFGIDDWIIYNCIINNINTELQNYFDNKHVVLSTLYL